MIIDEVAGGLDNSWIDFDVTSKIQEFAINPILNNGFAIDTYAEARWIKVYSSEHDNPGLRPKIVIIYDNDDPVSIDNSRNKVKETIRITRSSGLLLIYLYHTMNHNVSMYNLSGQKLFSVIINGKNQWHRIPKVNIPGIRVVRITSPAGIIVKKVNISN